MTLAMNYVFITISSSNFSMSCCLVLLMIHYLEGETLQLLQMIIRLQLSIQITSCLFYFNLVLNS